MDTFWSTEVNFCPIPACEGSIPVSDTVFAHSQGFSESSDVKKPSQSSVVWQKTAREQLLLSCLRGSPGTKITLKTTLEGVIRPRNKRVARGVMCRRSQSLQVTPNDKYWPRNDQMMTQSRFQKSKISDDFSGVVDPMSHLRYVFQQWPRFLPHNFPEMFRKPFLTWLRPFYVCVDGFWGQTFLVMYTPMYTQSSNG